jgi:4-hydroxy 2-oxovalerate aldolase
MHESRAPQFPARKVEILDATLRDGSYAVDFQLDEEFVRKLLRRLEGTPIGRVEVGHGLGFEAERSGIRASNIDLPKWCEIAGQELLTTPWGMFAQPGFSRLETLADLCKEGMSFVRIGMEPEKVPDHLDYIERATEICGEVHLNLMKTSGTPAQELPELLRDIPAVDGLYVVDSCGSMMPDDVRRYVNVAKEICPVVGFHGHDNLGMANANSIAAFEAGATIADGTLDGIGRGAGNAETESLAGIMRVLGEDRFDYKELAQLAHFCRTSLDLLPEDRTMQVLGGVIGIHSGFFPFIDQLCGELAVEPAPLMEAAVGLARYSAEKSDLRAAAQHLSRQTVAA